MQGLKGPFTSPVENRENRSEISDRCWKAPAIIRIKDEGDLDQTWWTWLASGYNLKVQYTGFATKKEREE